MLNTKQPLTEDLIKITVIRQKNKTVDVCFSCPLVFVFLKVLATVVVVAKKMVEKVVAVGRQLSDKMSLKLWKGLKSRLQEQTSFYPLNMAACKRLLAFILYYR